MSNKYDFLKEKVCLINKNISLKHLAVLTWGNASARDHESGYIAIKPSGVDFESLTPNDIVIVDINGNIIEGNLKPSSDLKTHLEIYKAFPQINGVIHTHSTFAVAFAQAQEPIPMLGTTHADTFDGNIPLTREFIADDFKEYEKSTGKIIVETLGNMNPLDMPAVLVRNHGPFSFGSNIEEAFNNSIALEEVAKMAYLTLSIKKEENIKKETLLFKKHHERKHGKNAYYGQKK